MEAPRRLTDARRVRVALALNHYRVAAQEAALAVQRLRDIRVPSCARWSHIGATTGSPGNPTATRAVQAWDVQRRHEASAFLSDVIGAWLWSPQTHPDDRLLLALVHGMHREERVTLLDAAAALGIPCRSAHEVQAVESHYDALLLSVGNALDAGARTWRWSA